MADDVLEFLDEATAKVEVTEQVQEPVKVAEPVVETPTPEASAAGEVVVPPEGEETPAAEDDTKVVPLGTALGWRDRMVAAEKALKESKPAPEAEFVPPDPAKQPVEFARYTQQVMELNLMNERMNVSERFARKEHGNDLVDKARTWSLSRFDADPQFANHIVNNADPYEASVEAYKEHLEFEAFKASKKGATVQEEAPVAGEGGERKIALATPVAKVPQPVVKKPAPRSIASEASAGGTHAIPVGEGQAFDSVFPG